MMVVTTTKRSNVLPRTHILIRTRFISEKVPTTFIRRSIVLEKPTNRRQHGNIGVAITQLCVSIFPLSSIKHSRAKKLQCQNFLSLLQHLKKNFVNGFIIHHHPRHHLQNQQKSCIIPQPMYATLH